MLAVYRALTVAAALMGSALLPPRAAGQSSSPIRFGSSGISFPSSALSFSSSAISFPSSPMQAETATTVEITLPADVLFDFDRSDLRPAAQSTLAELAQIIRSKARGAVTIQGFTDALGAEPYNQKLSERRAGAVRSWLAAKEAIPAKGLSAVGFGARNPVAPNRRPDGSDDPDGRQLNRRVTVIIKK